MHSRYFMTIVCLLVVFLCPASPGFSANRAGVVTLSPQAGFYLFDSEQKLKDSAVYGVALGYNFDQHWSAEAVLAGLMTEEDRTGGEDVDITQGRMDVLYHFLAEQDFVPFLALGAGVAEVSPDGLDSDTDLLLAYGGGFKYFLNDRVALRFDARHLLDINDEDIQRKDDLVHNLSFVGGFTFNFGSISSTPATYSSQEKETAEQVAEKEVIEVIEKAEVAAKPVVDSDRDGVIDSLDRCADTPRGTLVDAVGCPEPVKFVDSDSDGVADALDACKNTPAGAEVNKRGCPLPDGDRDGVIDRDDTCPGTAENLPVDEYGCPKLSEKLKIAGLVIEYATGQSVFSDEAARELRLLAAKVNSTQQGMLVVEGHTDSVGGVFYNVELSKERAEKVRKTLIDDFGVPANRVVSKGLGPYQPIADNNTQEGRQQNRRVVVRYQP